MAVANTHKVFFLFLGFILSNLDRGLAQNLTANAQPDNYIATTGKRVSISGQVVDTDANTPVLFAFVQIQELDISTLSDIKGDFQFNRIHTGNYTITVSAVGFASKTINLKLQSDTLIILQLKIGETTLPEATVSIHTHEEDDSHQGVSSKELEKQAGKTLGKILETVPGVNSLSTGSGISKPVIHGMHSTRVIVMNNGLRHESQRWGTEHAPEIDPFSAEELTVIKGAQGIKYGSDAIAGVVLVHPPALRTKFGMNAKVQLAGESNGRLGASSLMIEGKHRLFIPLSWRVQGSTKRSGSSHTPDYYLTNTGLQEYNYSGAIGYKGRNLAIDLFYSRFNTKIGIYKGAHIGNVTDLKRILQGETLSQSDDFTYDILRPYQKIGHELTKLQLAYYLDDNSKLSVCYGRQVNLREEFDNDPPLNDSIAALNLPDLRFGLTTHQGEVLYKNHHNKEDRTIGVGYKHMQNTSGGSFFVPNSRSQNIHAFVLDHWELQDWEIAAGLRYEYQFLEIFMFEDGEVLNPTHQFSHLAAQASVDYTINDKSKIDLQAGYSWRPPAVVELYANGLHHGAASIEKGDSQLDIEQVINTNLNVHHQRKKLDLELSLFYNFFPNFIYAAPSNEIALTIRGAFPIFSHTQTQAHFYGSDLFLKYEATDHIFITNKSNITLAKDLTNQDYLIGITPARSRFEVGYVNQTKWFIKEYQLKANISTVAKQNRVPENGDYAPPPNGYVLLGFSTDFNLDVKGYNFSMTVGVDNALNTSYRDYMNRLRYFSDELGRNFFIRTTLPLNF